MDQTEAARAVLIEVVNILGAFKSNIVIVGGWVPDLKYPGRNHIGSLDIDLAVGPGALGSDAYSTILGRLKKNNYSHQTAPTRFYRTVPGLADPVKVDLISGEYVNKERTAGIQVDELRLNTLRGVDLACEICEEITIEGRMPVGTHNIVRAWIPRPEAFILIKAFALDERTNAKDAYDIAFVLHHYEPNLTTLAERLRPHVAKGLGREAYEILKAKFASIDSVGPSGAANVFPGTAVDFEQLRRAAFEDAQTLFEAVDRGDMTGGTVP
jgi:hypothetical protein